jgi:hypothetical protein
MEWLDRAILGQCVLKIAKIELKDAGIAVSQNDVLALFAAEMQSEPCEHVGSDVEKVVRGTATIRFSWEAARRLPHCIGRAVTCDSWCRKSSLPSSKGRRKAKPRNLFGRGKVPPLEDFHPARWKDRERA